ncbi:MAG: DUF4434 domain-containing protein [Fimbriimonas sp.]
MPAPPFPSGTFLQGWLAAAYSAAQLDAAFQKMVEVGVRVLVVQTTFDERDAHKPPRSVPSETFALYPSEIEALPPGVVRRDTVRMILERAHTHGMRVFLGLNLYHQAWFHQFDTRPFVNDRAWLAAEAARGNAVAEELYTRYKADFHDTFYGWYWAWEVDNSDAMVRPETRTKVAGMMNANFNRLREIDASMPIMISSFYNAKLGTPDEHAAYWTELLAEVPSYGAGDVFAPQDGVGPAHVSIDALNEWFGALKAAIDTKPGLALWANCETFQELCEDREAAKCPEGKTLRVSAPLRRVVRQYEAVAPHVERIVTFAYPHYGSPLQVNRAFHDAWIAYGQTGTLSEETPPVPGALQARKVGGIVELSWTAQPGPNGDSGFVVWRNGREIRRVEIPRQAQATVSVEDRAATGARNRYEVVAFDAIGNHSARAAVTGP